MMTEGSINVMCLKHPGDPEAYGLAKTEAFCRMVISASFATAHGLVVTRLRVRKED